MADAATTSTPLPESASGSPRALDLSTDALATALRSAGLAALVTAGLGLPLIGFKTVEDIHNDLVLETRWDLLAAIVALVGLARFLQMLGIAPWLAGWGRLLAVRTAAALGRGAQLPANALWHAFRASRPRAAKTLETAAAPLLRRVRDLPASLRGSGRIVTLLLVAAYPAIVLALAGFQGAIKWIDNFGIQILIYMVLGWGLNIVVGLTGLLDLGYAAFYAVGAYSYALFAKTFGLWFWLALPLAGAVAAAARLLLGLPVLRLRGDYLAIVTLAFGEIVRLVLINWVPVTNGYAGIRAIPRPTFFGIPFTADDDGFAAVFGLEFSPVYRTIFLYYLILALALVTAAVTLRLRRLPVGRAWEALREDEIGCRSLGINTTATKLSAFAISGAFAGFAGSFFAVRQGFISPDSFTFLESAVIVAIVVLGGMGSMLGTAIAAVVMIGGTEIMRDLDVLKALFGDAFDPTQYRMLLFGLAMVLIMIWKPRGLIATREPTIRIGDHAAPGADGKPESRQ